MDTQLKTAMSSFVYNRIPTKVSRKDFNRYIDPHLKRPKIGPKPKPRSTKSFTTFCMSCIPGCSGINSKPSAMNSMTPTSINGTIDGPKMARIKRSFRPRLSSCITPISSTPPFSTVIGSNTVVKKGASASAVVYEGTMEISTLTGYPISFFA